MGNPVTVPMLAPDGSGWGSVPAYNVAKARAAGGIVGIHVTGPDGTTLPVRADRLHEALAAGGKIAPMEGTLPPPPQGFWGALGSDLAGIPAGLLNMGKMVGEGLSGDPAHPAITQAVVNALQQNESEKTAGYGLPYRAAAGAASLAGTNVPGMEQAAREGSVGGVLGHATAGATLAASPLIVEGALRGANAVLPSTTRSGAGIGILRDRLNPIPVTEKLPSYTTATELIDKWDRTKAPVPPQLRAYTENAASAGASGQPLTFQDLWEHREALNDLKYQSDVPGKAKMQIGHVADQMKDELQSIADQQGVGKDWQAQQAEYAKGKGIIRGADKVGPYLGAMAGYEAGRALGSGTGMELMMGAGGRYAGRPIVGGLARAIIERNAGAPHMGALPSATPGPPVPPVPAWPAEYQNAPQTLSTEAGGGANYTAADLAALKERHGIAGPPEPDSAATVPPDPAHVALNEQLANAQYKLENGIGDRFQLSNQIRDLQDRIAQRPGHVEVQQAQPGQVVEGIGPNGEVDRAIARRAVRRAAEEKGAER